MGTKKSNIESVIEQMTDVQLIKICTQRAMIDQNKYAAEFDPGASLVTEDNVEYEVLEQWTRANWQ